MKSLILTFLLLMTTTFACESQDINTAEWICNSENAGATGMPMFHRTYHLDKPVRKVTVTSSALGVYVLKVNGVRIDDEQLKPGWTDYRKEVFYQTAELPKSLTEGDSLSITAQLSNGWWIGGITRGVYGQNNRHAFVCSVLVEYKDGSKVHFSTDGTWQCTSHTPLLSGDIYNGEVYDATITPSAWHNAAVYEGHAPMLKPAFGPAVKIRDKALWRKPQNFTIYQGSVPTETTFGRINVVDERHAAGFTLKKGQTVLVDFGQNMVGWIDFTVSGKAGTQLTWTFGEMLNYNGDEARLDKGPGGSLWTYNLRSAKASLIYTMRGGGAESYHPEHSFFGFRYAELTASDDCCLKSVIGQVVGSDIKEWGTFECSNPDINQLYSNVWWGQRGNFLSIPTDCPQRDERLGWTGDTQIFSVTALYNSDSKDFYRKWMGDMRASQRKDGAYPETAPFANMWGYGTSAWGDAGVIVPWNVYWMTGDKTIIEENYSSMQRWIDFCGSQSEGEWTHIGAEPKTGDWLAYKEVQPRYVSYAYFAYSAELMAKMADILGKAEDAERYRKLHEDVVDEFHRRYVSDDEINISKDTQTAYLLFLHFHLWKSERQLEMTKASLRRNIETNGYKLSTGFVGTGILMNTLTEYDMDDLAYRLLLQRENPSWLYSIDQGATTVWERWDSYTQAEGFHKHHWNMNSFNHYSYGAVAEWFYSTILGICPDEPGFQTVCLKPRFGGGLTWARGGTTTPRGDVRVEWKQQKDNTYKYTVVVPKNTKAKLLIKGREPITFVGNGKRQTFVIDADN